MLVTPEPLMGEKTEMICPRLLSRGWTVSIAANAAIRSCRRLLTSRYSRAPARMASRIKRHVRVAGRQDRARDETMGRADRHQAVVPVAVAKDQDGVRPAGGKAVLHLLVRGDVLCIAGDALAEQDAPRLVDSLRLAADYDHFHHAHRSLAANGTNAVYRCQAKFRDKPAGASTECRGRRRSRPSGGSSSKARRGP